MWGIEVGGDGSELLRGFFFQIIYASTYLEGLNYTFGK